MENQTFRFNTEKDQVTILQGKAEDPKPSYRKKHYEITGGPGTVEAIALKHPVSTLIKDLTTNQAEQALHNDIFLYMNKNTKTLGLEVYTIESSITDTYQTVLKHSEAFKVFGINTGKSYTTFELANLIKMNRSAFNKKQDAAELVSLLITFEAKIDAQIKKEADSRGNRKALVQQTVNSNIPENFVLNLEIFEGTEKELIDIEIIIDADDFSCQLISPDAKESEDRMVGSILDEEAQRIIQAHPQIKYVKLI